jgi:hypothetical protein
MHRLPWVLPLSLARGARPTRLAAWAWSRDPSSGVSTTSTFAVASPRFPRGLGEASGLTGIDLDQGQAGLDERLLERAMVCPCRLENDSGDIEPLKPFDEGAMAFRIVGDAAACPSS